MQIKNTKTIMQRLEEVSPDGFDKNPPKYCDVFVEEALPYINLVTDLIKNLPRYCNVLDLKVSPYSLLVAIKG